MSKSGLSDVASEETLLSGQREEVPKVALLIDWDNVNMTMGRGGFNVDGAKIRKILGVLIDFSQKQGQIIRRDIFITTKTDNAGSIRRIAEERKKEFSVYVVSPSADAADELMDRKAKEYADEGVNVLIMVSDDTYFVSTVRELKQKKAETTLHVINIFGRNLKFKVSDYVWALMDLLRSSKKRDSNSRNGRGNNVNRFLMAALFKKDRLSPDQEFMKSCLLNIKIFYESGDWASFRILRERTWERVKSKWITRGFKPQDCARVINAFIDQAILHKKIELYKEVEISKIYINPESQHWLWNEI